MGVLRHCNPSSPPPQCWNEEDLHCKFSTTLSLHPWKKADTVVWPYMYSCIEGLVYHACIWHCAALRICYLIWIFCAAHTVCVGRNWLTHL